MSSLKVNHITETVISDADTSVITLNKLFISMIFQVNTDNMEIYIKNNEVEVMRFDLDSMKKDYQLNSPDFFIYTYSNNRWLLDFKNLGGFYSEGAIGMDIGFRFTGATVPGFSAKLNRAMVLWKDR